MGGSVHFGCVRVVAVRGAMDGTGALGAARCSGQHASCASLVGARACVGAGSSSCGSFGCIEFDLAASTCMHCQVNLLGNIRIRRDILWQRKSWLVSSLQDCYIETGYAERKRCKSLRVECNGASWPVSYIWCTAPPVGARRLFVTLRSS